MGGIWDRAAGDPIDIKIRIVEMDLAPLPGQRQGPTQPHTATLAPTRCDGDPLCIE